MERKTPIQDLEKSAIMYKINFKDCPANYIGETGKRPEIELHEHECAIGCAEGNLQLWMQIVEADHQFKFSEAAAKEFGELKRFNRQMNRSALGLSREIESLKGRPSLEKSRSKDSGMIDSHFSGGSNLTPLMTRLEISTFLPT